MLYEKTTKGDGILETKTVAALLIIVFLAGVGVGWFIPRPAPTVAIMFNSTQLRPAAETEWVTKSYA